MGAGKAVNRLGGKGHLITVVLNKNGENPSVKFDGYNQLIYQEIKDVSNETSA